MGMAFLDSALGGCVLRAHGSDEQAAADAGRPQRQGWA
jgi:hypothetical protein